MTASRPMAYSRTSPMNDLFRPNKNDAIDRHRLDGPTFHRDTEKPPGRRTQVRRRRGGGLFALGGLLLLAGGLTLGGWKNYALKQEVMATAKQERDFVPQFACGGCRGEPRHDFGHPPRHHRRIRCRQHLWPSDRLYRQAKCRYRGSRQGGRVAGGA